MDTTLLQALVALAVGALLILAGIAVVHILDSIKANATPSVQVILAALLPWALKAIIAGELIAADELDQFDRELDGLDKAAIAASLYNLLPNTIMVAGKPIDITLIKHLVTLEAWTAFVEQNFQEVQALIISARDYLRKQIPAPDPSPSLRTVSSTSGAVMQSLAPDMG